MFVPCPPPLPNYPHESPSLWLVLWAVQAMIQFRKHGKFLSYFPFNCGEVLKPVLRENSQQCAWLQPLCPPRVCALCTSCVRTRQGIPRLALVGLCRPVPCSGTAKLTNGCRTWRLCLSLDVRFGYSVLLFNGVNQISANGKKGKTLRKSWQSRKNRMTELWD